MRWMSRSPVGVLHVSWAWTWGNAGGPDEDGRLDEDAGPDTTELVAAGLESELPDCEEDCADEACPDETCADEPCVEED